MIKLSLGDVVTTKKPHPCGSKKWTVTRVGADYKLACDGCGRVVLMDEKTLNKSVVTVNGERVDK